MVLYAYETLWDSTVCFHFHASKPTPCILSFLQQPNWMHKPLDYNKLIPKNSEISLNPTPPLIINEFPYSTNWWYHPFYYFYCSLYYWLMLVYEFIASLISANCWFITSIVLFITDSHMTSSLISPTVSFITDIPMISSPLFLLCSLYYWLTPESFLLHNTATF